MTSSFSMVCQLSLPDFLLGRSFGFYLFQMENKKWSFSEIISGKLLAFVIPYARSFQIKFTEISFPYSTLMEEILLKARYFWMNWFCSIFSVDFLKHFRSVFIRLRKTYRFSCRSTDFWKNPTGFYRVSKCRFLFFYKIF